jgi:ankyrin repeat protein
MPQRTYAKSSRWIGALLPEDHRVDELVDAIYRAPLAVIAELVAVGADVNADHGDGFPPLIAALTCATSYPGSPARPDVLDIVRLLLAAGADPNQRGINDWTPLHAAIGYRALDAIPLLLAAGADASLCTRIDDYETPAEMAQSAGLAEVAELLS